ncbi:MAG: hypothetical protein QNJ97_10365 [Myxococcota bacterium]|nr:hypothetical protein [Myxococcota bacterium]
MNRVPILIGPHFLIAALALALPGCNGASNSDSNEDANSSDSVDTGQDTNISSDSDVDTNTELDSDLDTNTESESDSAVDTETESNTDIDTETETGTDTYELDTDWELPCDPYPDGPYNWSLETTVSHTAFPAMWGPEGALTNLDMCEVHKNHNTLKSLIFALEQPGCGCLAEQLRALADNYDKVLEYNSDIVAVSYSDLTNGVSLPPEAVSPIVNSLGWTGGWRIQDSEQQIWIGGCYDQCLFQTAGVLFVLDTATMSIASYSPLDFAAVLEVIKQIDTENP